jgi:hypothetical protein
MGTKPSFSLDEDKNEKLAGSTADFGPGKLCKTPDQNLSALGPFLGSRRLNHNHVNPGRKLQSKLSAAVGFSKRGYHRP